MEPFRYKLSEPIKAHGDDLHEIVMPLPLRAKHLKQTDGIEGNNSKVMKLIEVVCGIPPSSVGEIPYPDLQGIAEDIMPFLARSPKTTETF